MDSKNGVGNDSLVLDYSGNGMHTAVSNFDMSQRVTGAVSAISDPMVGEDSALSPIALRAFTLN